MLSILLTSCALVGTPVCIGKNLKLLNGRLFSPQFHFGPDYLSSPKVLFSIFSFISQPFGYFIFRDILSYDFEHSTYFRDSYTLWGADFIIWSVWTCHVAWKSQEPSAEFSWYLITCPVNIFIETDEIPNTAAQPRMPNFWERRIQRTKTMFPCRPDTGFFGCNIHLSFMTCCSKVWFLNVLSFISMFNAAYSINDTSLYCRDRYCHVEYWTNINFLSLHRSDIISYWSFIPW